MSFITTMIKGGVQSQADRDAEMRARIASTSIYAQRVADGFENPEVTVFHPMTEFRISDRPMYGCAHADVKNTDAGIRSSFMAAKASALEAKKRRDELLAKYSGSSEEQQE